MAGWCRYPKLNLPYPAGFFFCPETDPKWLKSSSEGVAYLAGLVSDAAYSPIFLKPEILLCAQKWIQYAERGVRSSFSPINDRLSDNRLGTAYSLLELNPADRILISPFSLEEARQLAVKLGISNENGDYILGPRKLGAVVGFCVALQQAGKLTGAISDLTAVIGPLLGVKVKTRKMTTGIAQHYERLTKQALAFSKKAN